MTYSLKKTKDDDIDKVDEVDERGRALVVVAALVV